MDKNARKLQRQRRVRKKLRLNADAVRLSVFRSNRFVYAQLIDDKDGKTLASVSQKTLKTEKGMTPTEAARMVGMELAKKAQDKKITNVVFDKGSYAYHGRVKAIAEGAREGGLSF